MSTEPRCPHYNKDGDYVAESRRSVTQCLILAGGLGTRLRKVVDDRPKALADIVNKPFLYYQIHFLAKNGIKEIVLCTGYMGDKIKNYINQEVGRYGSRVGDIRVKFSDEGDSLLGTGGAIKNAAHLLNERFFLLNGDSLFLSDLREIAEYHSRFASEITIGLTQVHDYTRYGVVILENSDAKFSRIRGFYEKERVEARSLMAPIINAGVYVFEKTSIECATLPKKFSLERDFMSQMLTKLRIYGYLDKEAYFLDMGTPHGYKKLQEDIASHRILI